MAPDASAPAAASPWPARASILAAAGALCAARLVQRLARRRGPGEGIPWARGWWPLVGHALMLRKYMKGNNALMMGRLATGVKQDEGKSIFRVSFFGIGLVVVADVDAIEEIVTNDPVRFGKNFVDAPGQQLSKDVFGDGLIFADSASENWMVPHGILKAPFSTKGVRELMPMMCDQADLLVQCLQKEVGYGGVCHIDTWVTKMAFETIAVCAAGTSFGSFNYRCDHPFIKALNDVMLRFKKIQSVPPQFWSIFFRKDVAEIRALGRVLRETCMDVIRKRRNGETHAAAGKRDIMDKMLGDTDPKTGKAMTEEQITDNVLTFLFAGQDSTAAAMATLLCYLCANPRCKENLVREIDRVVGGGPLNWDQLGELQYLDWCIKEGMRLVPPAVAVARAANGDQLLSGKWRVPAGSFVMVGIMAVHYDRGLWGEDAYEFKPERWAHGAPSKYAYLPFAHGPRACTGREFTLIEQKVTFVKLLQHFDFKRPESVTPEPGYTTFTKEKQVMPPFIGMDVEYKDNSAFVGLSSAFELLEREVGR